MKYSEGLTTLGCGVCSTACPKALVAKPRTAMQLKNRAMLRYVSEASVELKLKANINK